MKMNTFRKANVSATGINQCAILLHSDKEFERWYLNHFDFTMFSYEEVRSVLEEERPECYPCIPIRSDDSHGVIFVGEDLVKHWINTLYREKHSSL